MCSWFYDKRTQADGCANRMRWFASEQQQQQRHHDRWANVCLYVSVPVFVLLCVIVFVLVFILLCSWIYVSSGALQGTSTTPTYKYVSLVVFLDACCRCFVFVLLVFTVFVALSLSNNMDAGPVSANGDVTFQQLTGTTQGGLS